MIESLSKFYDLLSKRLGLKESVSNEIFFWIVTVVISIWLLKQFWNLLMKIKLRKNQKVLNKDLFPYYSKADVYTATKYYIETKYQNVAPSEDDEPGRRYIASAKDKLIPLFTDNIFLFENNHSKHYLILADSGMGKTTFLINLYIAYKNKFHDPFSVDKFNIKMLPIWYPDSIEDIKAIANQENTILLLDAFDEDIEAVKDYKKRLNQILKVTDKFRAIIITCRSQFFPSQKEEPHETGYFTGGENGEYFFQKLYLSVFDSKDVKKYLKKQFHVILQYKNYAKAKVIADKSPNLVVRPMLLSNIKDLVSSSKEYNYTYKIYEELINRWLDRESSKHEIKEKYGSSDSFKHLLYNFSKKLAKDLYINRIKRNGYFIPKDEDFASGILHLSDIDDHLLTLSNMDGRRKSLLNRTAAGEYKFSHKSILEYFLSLHLFEDMEFYLDFDFKGMDTAQLFLREMLIDKLAAKYDTSYSYWIEDTTAGKKNYVGKKFKNFSFSEFDKIEEIIIRANVFEPFLFKEFKNLRLIFLKSEHFRIFYKIINLITEEACASLGIDIGTLNDHIKSIGRLALYDLLAKIAGKQHLDFEKVSNISKELQQRNLLNLYKRILYRTNYSYHYVFIENMPYRYMTDADWESLALLDSAIVNWEKLKKQVPGLRVIADSLEISGQ